MSAPSHFDQIAERVERLLVRYEETQRTNALLQQQVEALARERDALKAHLALELNIDQEDVVSPWHAAFASLIAFTIGAVLPLLTILLLPHPARIVWTFVAVLLALAVTGYVAAWIGGSHRWRAVVRLVIGGALALGATFLVGSLFGTVVG